MDIVQNTPQQLKERWIRAERLNALSHFLGFLLVVGAVPVMITMAALRGHALEVVTFSVYSATLLLTYMTSTLYHYMPVGRVKLVLRRADHLSIYLLIAGTYTPFLLVSLGGVWGWSLFGALWALAMVGIFTKLRFGYRFRFVSTLAYVVMGWIGVVAFVPLFRGMPIVSVVLVLCGGVSYTVGAIFYAWRSLPHHHFIWHVFCLGGSILQFIAVFFLLSQ